MSKELIVKHIPAIRWYKKTRWELSESLEFFGYTVPKGFTFDGASTPRIIWLLFPPMGQYAKAACLHDYLVAGYKDLSVCRSADSAFRRALLHVKVPKWRVNCMYPGVRLYTFWKYLLKYFRKEG